MIDLLTIALEAHSDERNHHRRYEVSVRRDLLGDWVVTIRYGRVGESLREFHVGWPDVEQARVIVDDRLRRRLSAPTRIGCRYTVRQLNVAPGVVVSDWASPALLARLA
jgi:predicted DNA-binding WGR domain protein